MRSISVYSRSDLKKSHEESGGEFVPLIRATRGEAVPIPNMKMAVIKAIELVMAKLNAHDRLTEILSDARLVLWINKTADFE
jgi:hypothetical protein